MPNTHTNFDYPMIIGYWVMNYWNWSHFRYQALSLCMRRVTWPITGGQKWFTFWKSLTQFTSSFCHFKGDTMKIKPCY